MFSPSYRRSGPFPFTDLDMWDTKSHFTAQTSAWCGMAAVSGSGFLSKATASASGFRPRDPGLRKWQSWSHLAPERAARSFSSSAAESRAGQAGSNFRQAEVAHWLQDGHEQLDTRLDRLRTRDMQLDYSSAAANMFDMKQKLSKATSVLKEDAAEFLQFERSQHFEELREKALKLENDLLQMRANLNKGSNDQPTRLQAPSLLSRTLPENQEDFNKEKQKADSELCKLREALREAETRAATHEEERNKALQHLQTSAETQRMMLSQIEEMNKRLKQSVQNCSDVQEQLSEANNRISQACLDKAVLSTQVLKLEDNIKELKAKLTEVLSDKDHLMQEKKDLLQRILEMQLERTTHEPHECLTNAESKNNQDGETVLMKEELKSLRQVNEKLRGEQESIKQNFEISQHQLHELKEERIANSKQIIDLEAQRSQLIREKEELLSKINQSGHNMPTGTKEKCCQHRESVEVLELEKQKLQDQCLCLEAQVREKEDVLHLQKEEYQKQDAMRVRHIEELKSVVSHWTGKWQKVALSLQSTQDELKELRTTTINKKDSDSLVRAELDACKQELEQERSRSRALLQRYEGQGGEAVQTTDKDTETDTSESSLIHESPSDAQSHRNKSPQVLIQSHEVERLRQKLAEREKELSEKEHSLRSLERLRQMEKTETQIKISALELKLMKNVSEDCQDDGGLQRDVSLRTQLDESKRRAEELQQEKIQAVQRLQAQRQQLSPVKDEKPSVEGRKDQTFYTVNPEMEQQRRMVTEQLKSLFKEREGQEMGKDAAAQAGLSSVQNQTPTSLLVRTTDRRIWQQGSGLTPLFEEDEENSNWTGEEEEDPAEEAQTETSAVTAEIINNKTKSDSLLQALRCKQSVQHPQSAASASGRSSHFCDEGDLQWRSTPPLCPDGIFLAEIVDICSPDEDEVDDEEEGEF